MGETLRRVQMLIEPRQHDELRRRAELAGTSVAAVARRAIERGLESLDQESLQTRRMRALERARTLRGQGGTAGAGVDVAADLAELRKERDSGNASRRG